MIAGGMSRRGLGRGLEDLLGQVASDYENNIGIKDNVRVLDIDIEQVKVNPRQPRKHFSEESLKELADSILEYGLLQPVVVFMDKNNEYVLIAGERRLRASKLAKLPTIRAIVADIDIDKLRELALIENIQREDLNPIELAMAYQELLSEHKITHEELSRRINKSRTQITNTLRLLNLEPFVQDLITQERLTQGHAKILVGLSKDEQKYITNSILQHDLSVREVEKLAKALKDKDKTSSIQKRLGEMLDEKQLARAKELLESNGFQTRVKRNSICINFTKDEEISKFIKLFCEKL